MGKPLSREEVQNRITDYFVQRVELIGEYKNKRSKIILHCLECDYTWETYASAVIYRSNENAKHICPNCTKVQKVELTCAWCGKKFERYPSDTKKNKSGFFYCCREHGNLHKNKLRYDSGEWDNSSNYRLKAFSTYDHKCACCGWDEDIRILEVHHIDENHDNNSIDNLIILCPICHRKITLGYYFLDLNMKELIEKERESDEYGNHNHNSKIQR